jgi:hypothetical protein
MARIRIEIKDNKTKLHGMTHRSTHLHRMPEMENTMRLIRPILSLIVAVCLLAILAFAQGNYRAQLRGVVTDTTGAVLANATVTIRDEGTNVSSTAQTDDKGTYFFTGLRPSSYAVKVDAVGFRVTERTGVILAVDQESSLNFKLDLLSVLATMDVTATQPMLDTDSATLGTDITSEYVKGTPTRQPKFLRHDLSLGGRDRGGRVRHERQLSFGHELCLQRAAERDGRSAVGWRLNQRAGTGRGREFERLLRAPGRERAGIQGPEQQLFSGVWQQRRDGGQHRHEERNERLPWQRVVFSAACAVERPRLF